MYLFDKTYNYYHQTSIENQAFLYSENLYILLISKKSVYEWFKTTSTSISKRILLIKLKINQRISNLFVYKTIVINANHINNQKNMTEVSTERDNMVDSFDSEGELGEPAKTPITPKTELKDLKQKAKNPKKAFARLFSYTLKHKVWLIVSNLAMIISTLGMIYLPLLCGNMIDHIQKGQSLSDDTTMFLMLAFLMAAFSAIKGYGFNVLGQKIVLDLRKQLFKELARKDIEFYDKNKSGALISHLTSDTTVVQNAASDNISILLRNLLQFLGSLIFLFFLSWRLTALILLVIPIIAIIIIVIVKALKKFKKQYQQKLALANSLASQVFSNIRIVKSFSNENLQINNYDTLIKSTYSTGRKQAMVYSLMLFVIIMFANLLILLVLYFGGSMTLEEKLTIGDLTSFVLYTITLATGFTSVSGLMNQIASALGVCQKLFEIIDEPITIINGIKKSNLSTVQNAIEFKNATFAYPTKKSVNVIQNFNLSIKKGQSIAIVGASGSGKTSLINLILRFYDLDSGQLRVGQEKIKDIDLFNLRKNIGYVSQQSTLFSGSLRENIQYGIKEYQKNQSKLMNALEISNAKQFVMNKDKFPETLNTIVGERGVKLSGGQRQRIAIARSIIKDPKLLIFDQATSALDSESEHLVQSAIDKLVDSKNCTMIIVAHRLSTIINCDRIIVLKEGKIIEEGPHKDLLAKNGYYANLIKKQVSTL